MTLILVWFNQINFPLRGSTIGQGEKIRFCLMGREDLRILTRRTHVGRTAGGVPAMGLGAPLLVVQASGLLG